MTRKCFLITILIIPQYLTSVQSSPFDESHLYKLSDELLIAGWKPLSDKNIKDQNYEKIENKLIEVFTSNLNN